MKQSIKDTADTIVESIPSSFAFWMGGFRGPGYDIESDGVRITFDETKVGTTCALSSEIMPTARAWDRFWHRLDAINIWEWESEYSNPEVRDGTLWTLEISHGGRSLVTRGDNAYPNPVDTEEENNGPSPEFSALLTALGQLCGGKEIA
jgi:hypothetical protein